MPTPTIPRLKIAVISPDLATGMIFAHILRKHTKTIPNIYIKQENARIPARIKDGTLTKDKEGVIQALATALCAATHAGYSYATIACNTLSLPLFVEPARRAAQHQLGKKPLPLVTTIQLLQHRAKKRAILATKPVVIELIKQHVNDSQPYPIQSKKVQNLVQRIIWRTKKLQGSEMSSAPESIQSETSETNEQKLEHDLLQLVQLLHEQKISEVILACTELPASFAFLQEKHPSLPLPKRIDPAKYVALELVKRLAD